MIWIWTGFVQKNRGAIISANKFARLNTKTLGAEFGTECAEILLLVLQYHDHWWHLRAFFMAQCEMFSFFHLHLKGGGGGDFHVCFLPGLIHPLWKRSRKRFTTCTIKVQVRVCFTTCIKPVISLDTNGVRSFGSGDDSIHRWNADFK